MHVLDWNLDTARSAEVSSGVTYGQLTLRVLWRCVFFLALERVDALGGPENVVLGGAALSRALQFPAALIALLALYLLALAAFAFVAFGTFTLAIPIALLDRSLAHERGCVHRRRGGQFPQRMVRLVGHDATSRVGADHGAEQVAVH